MKKTVPREFLRRYTTLPVLLDMLVHKRVVLLSPASWEDRNDAYFLQRYREERALKTLVALCFSMKQVTFHHWKVFSGNGSGVCVELWKDEFLKPLAAVKGLRCARVEYFLLRNIRHTPPNVERWPFLKRKPFEDEGEFRLVYESAVEETPTKALPFDLRAIAKIVLAPWMPESVANSVKEVIKRLDGCEQLRIDRSSLLDVHPVRNVLTVSSPPTA